VYNLLLPAKRFYLFFLVFCINHLNYFMKAGKIIPLISIACYLIALIIFLLFYGIERGEYVFFARFLIQLPALLLGLLFGYITLIMMLLKRFKPGLINVVSIILTSFLTLQILYFVIVITKFK